MRTKFLVVAITSLFLNLAAISSSICLAQEVIYYRSIDKGAYSINFFRTNGADWAGIRGEVTKGEYIDITFENNLIGWRDAYYKYGVLREGYTVYDKDSFSTLFPELSSFLPALKNEFMSIESKNKIVTSAVSRKVFTKLGMDVSKVADGDLGKYERDFITSEIKMSVDGKPTAKYIEYIKARFPSVPGLDVNHEWELAQRARKHIAWDALGKDNLKKWEK